MAYATLSRAERTAVYNIAGGVPFRFRVVRDGAEHDRPRRSVDPVVGRSVGRSPFSFITWRGRRVENSLGRYSLPTACDWACFRGKESGPPPCGSGAHIQSKSINRYLYNSSHFSLSLPDATQLARVHEKRYGIWKDGEEHDG